MSSSLSLLDVHEIHEVSVLLSAASSSPDSGSSIGTGSPTLQISERDVRSSFCSSHGTPTVKFAPLPQIDTNRKRSLVPLGVSARSRRKQIIQEECGSLTWSPDPDVPETMEDPIIMLAKFVKKTGQTLWRRLKKRSKAGPQGNEVSNHAEFVMDIRPIVQLGDGVAPGEKGHRMPDGAGAEVKRGRSASWSPSSGERGTLNQESWQDLRMKRSSTGDLPSSPFVGSLSR